MNPLKRDRQLSAYHEAGHGVVAVALHHARVRLTLYRRPSPGPDDKVYAGQTQWFDLTRPKIDMAAMGYAGAMAELLLHDGVGKYDDVFAADYALQEMSPRDRGLVDLAVGRYEARARVRAWTILNDNWDFVACVAKELMRDQRRDRPGVCVLTRRRFLSERRKHL